MHMFNKPMWRVICCMLSVENMHLLHAALYNTYTHAQTDAQLLWDMHKYVAINAHITAESVP